MILPTRISEVEYINRRNGLNDLPRLDGLYLVGTAGDNGSHLIFHLNGFLWSIMRYHDEIMCHAGSSYRIVPPEKLLDFVNHNTPECIDILLYVLPDPTILFDPDFPCRN